MIIFDNIFILALIVLCAAACCREIWSLRLRHSKSMADELMKSVKELTGLAAAIQAFDSRFQDLQNHLNFIQTTIDAKLNRYTSPEELDFSTPVVVEATSHQTQIAPAETENQTTTTKTMSPTQPSRRSELHYLCEMMCSRGLRKYVVTHLSDAQRLRRDATLALKSAPNPAKLVLECVGRFFLQGRKAYTTNSPIVSCRAASVLVLEFFLKLIGESESEIEIEKWVKQEAEKDAIAWRKRLMSEGGVLKACEIDARGLLLFISCFGIPKDFRNDDVRDLIRSSNLKEICDLLKGSRVLVARIPDIIENMTKKGMHVEAVQIVYDFGIQDKFSPHKLLTSFLRASKEAWKKRKRDGPLPLSVSQDEANEKHLADLKSVIKCLEDRKVDPARLLPGWQIKEKIVKLEKDIAELSKQITDNNMMPKRKVGDIESSIKLNYKEAKRSRFMTNGSSLMSSSNAIRLHDPRPANYASPNVIRLHDPAPANYADRKSSHDISIPNLLDRGFSGYINNHFSAADASNGYSAGPVADGLAAAVQHAGSVHAGAVEVGVSAGSVLPTTSFSVMSGAMSVDKGGPMIYGNASPDGRPRVGDAAYDDRVTGQSFVGQPPAMGVDNMYKPSSHFPGLLGPTSISVGNQNSSSDLYSFADAVM